MGKTKAFALGKELAFVNSISGGISASDVLISTTTGALLGLASNQLNVEIALQTLASNVVNIDGYLLAIIVKDYTGKAYPNIKINGVTNLYDSDAITDSNGFCLCKTSSTNPTLSVSSPYLDLADVSISPLLSTGAIYEGELIFNRKIGQDQTIGKIYVENSGNYKFSPYVTQLDLCAVGGGGGSGGGITTYSAGYNKHYPGSGGGGGHVATKIDVNFKPDIEYQFIVGSGGNGSRAPGAGSSGNGSEQASAGQATSVPDFNLSADGGGGGYSAWSDSYDDTDVANISGSGNGNGGFRRAPATNGTERGLDGELFGGGGAGGYEYSGGEPYGADMVQTPGYVQNGAKGYGGGAAGTYSGADMSGSSRWFTSAAGGQGANGVIVCKVYY